MTNNKIIVVGIGPGSPEYVVPKAKSAIEKAKVLVGGKRVLSDYASAEQDTIIIGSDIIGVINAIRHRLDISDVVVIVSGDPGYFSLLDRLRMEFPPNLIEVIAGISSIQFAFTRLALPWHEARLISFHGRYPREQDLVYNKGSTLGMLTDGKYNSRTIAEILLNHGWQMDNTMHICTRLSYEDEQIVTTTLKQASIDEAIGHGVIIVEA